VLAQNPRGRSLWWAVRYVVSIRTNVVLVTASALGYFFFAGLGTFGIALLRRRFQLSQAPATLLIGVIGLGALIGALCTGRLADWLIDRGYIGARMTVAGVAFLVAAGFCLPALLFKNLPIMMFFAFLAAIGLGGVNPPLDAGRLDIMHSRLWGRAEAVRTTLRSVVTSIAPLLFGFASTQLGGSATQFGGAAAGLASQHGALADSAAARADSAARAAAIGLDQTFLIMLVPLVIGGVLILLAARRTYPRDVATAIASEHTAPPN
jgi:MFS family permease